MISLIALLRQNSPPAKATTATNVAGDPAIGAPSEGRRPISSFTRIEIPITTKPTPGKKMANLVRHHSRLISNLPIP